MLWMEYKTHIQFHSKNKLSFRFSFTLFLLLLRGSSVDADSVAPQPLSSLLRCFTAHAPPHPESLLLSVPLILRGCRPTRSSSVLPFFYAVLPRDQLRKNIRSGIRISSS